MLQASLHTFCLPRSSARPQMLKDLVFVGSWRGPELHFQRARSLFPEQKVYSMLGRKSLAPRGARASSGVAG